MKPSPIPFSKYDSMGAYHWVECDRSSHRYNPALLARYEVLVRRIGGAKRVLDVGCGDGYLMSRISAHCASVVGIDSELTGVVLAIDKLRGLPNCSVTQASCYSLPFADRQFDAVLLADVIEHLERPEICLTEIRRILVPDGILLLTTPKWRPDRMWDGTHFKEYRPDELKAKLEPLFPRISFIFFWPMTWCRFYATRIGWIMTRLLSRHLYNPFLHEGTNPESYGQILAVCENGRPGLIPCDLDQLSPNAASEV